MKMDNVGFVICNGESRKGFNLEMLRRYGPIFGCNALYRDFRPDVLFAGEQHMIDEITAADYCGPRSFRLPGQKRALLDWTGPGSKEVIPDDGWACGPTATLLMCQRENVDIVFMIAADIFSLTGRHDNIYKGTNCYRPADGDFTATVNFINQLTCIFNMFPDISFYRVTDPKNPHPQGWCEHKNVESITYKKMMDILKNDLPNNK